MAAAAGRINIQLQGRGAVRAGGPLTGDAPAPGTGPCTMTSDCSQRLQRPPAPGGPHTEPQQKGTSSSASSHTWAPRTTEEAGCRQAGEKVVWTRALWRGACEAAPTLAYIVQSERNLKVTASYVACLWAQTGLVNFHPLGLELLSSRPSHAREKYLQNGST